MTDRLAPTSGGSVDSAGLPDAHDPRERRVAVIDLGSNTFRLVVFRYRPGGPFQLSDEIREVVRLSAGAKGGVLTKEAIARARRVAGLYAAFCRASGVDEVHAVATSAIRDAPNQDEVLGAMAAEGLDARVLSADEEARYGYLGTINSTILRDGLILDVGGGSIQVARVADRLLRRSVSEPLGAVRMTEAFLPSEKASRGELKALRKHVAGRLEQLDWMADGEGRLFGMGGSVRTLAAMALKHLSEPLSEVHGYLLTREVLAELVEAMAALPASGRDRLPGLKSDRADIMLAGAVVVEAVMDAAGANRMEVSAQGLREGVFYERFLAPADPPLIPDVRRHSVLNAARIYDYDAGHAHQVARLALGIFDGLARAGLHPGDERERELLWAAAILHDVGVLVDYNDHHKHSYYLVLNAGLPGFRHRELAMIALLVRHHRKASPNVEPLGSILGGGGETRLVRLAACLRLAEQLERGRAGLVRGVVPQVHNGTVHLEVQADADLTVAVWSAGREGAVFERAFGARLEIAPAGAGR